MFGPLPEWELFKIAKSVMAGEMGSSVQAQMPLSDDAFSHYCQSESWTADLGTGIFKLGAQAREQHGLPDIGECGLLTLIRCYDSGDRHHVLNLFESAALDACSFCFSTVIVSPEEHHRPVMCVGESSNFSDDGNGSMSGIFIFPRFILRQPPGAALQ